MFQTFLMCNWWKTPACLGTWQKFTSLLEQEVRSELVLINLTCKFMTRHQVFNKGLLFRINWDYEKLSFLSLKTVTDLPLFFFCFYNASPDVIS